MKVASNWLRSIELDVSGNPENLESTVGGILAQLGPDATVLRMTSFGEQVSERSSRDSFRRGERPASTRLPRYESSNLAEADSTVRKWTIESVNEHRA